MFFISSGVLVASLYFLEASANAFSTAIWACFACTWESTASDTPNCANFCLSISSEERPSCFIFSSSLKRESLAAFVACKLFIYSSCACDAPLFRASNNCFCCVDSPACLASCSNLDVSFSNSLVCSFAADAAPLCAFANSCLAGIAAFVLAISSVCVGTTLFNVESNSFSATFFCVVDLTCFSVARTPILSSTINSFNSLVFFLILAMFESRVAASSFIRSL